MTCPRPRGKEWWPLELNLGLLIPSPVLFFYSPVSCLCVRWLLSVGQSCMSKVSSLPSGANIAWVKPRISSCSLPWSRSLAVWPWPVVAWCLQHQRGEGHETQVKTAKPHTLLKLQGQVQGGLCDGASGPQMFACLLSCCMCGSCQLKAGRQERKKLCHMALQSFGVWISGPRTPVFIHPLVHSLTHFLTHS